MAIEIINSMIARAVEKDKPELADKLKMFQRAMKQAREQNGIGNSEDADSKEKIDSRQEPEEDVK